MSRRYNPPSPRLRFTLASRNVRPTRNLQDVSTTTKLIKGKYQHQSRTWPNRYTSRAYRQSFDLHIRIRFAKLQIA